MNDRLEKEEYIEKYIKSDHYVDNVFSSRTIDNFLTEEELDLFDNASKSDNVFYVHDTSMSPIAEKLNIGGETTAHYHIFSNFYNDPAWNKLVDIIQPKLENAFGKGIRASHIHVLDSRFPYGLHNDAEQPNMKIAPNPAWTLIIPLEDVDSTTYVFNERSGYKDPWSWIHANDIKAKDSYSIDKEKFAEDFDPFTDYELMRYLTVESTFKWKRGSCFAADRYRYHCSSNFFNKGIDGKRAIIVWTSVPDADH